MAEPCLNGRSYSITHTHVRHNTVISFWLNVRRFSSSDIFQRILFKEIKTLYRGGVTLSFHGNHLNVSAEPRLVIYAEEDAYSMVRRNCLIGAVVV